MADTWMRFVVGGSALGLVFLFHPPPANGQPLAAPGSHHVGPADEADELRGPARAALSEAYPGVRVQRSGTEVTAIFGTPMTPAPTPMEAAEGWIAEFAGELAVEDLDLRLRRSNIVRFGRFTVFAYDQYLDGLPVERGFARLLVLNGERNHVVYFGAKLARPPAGGFRSDAIDAGPALAVVRTQPTYAALHEWSAPEMAVFYHEPDGSVPAVRAWKFTGRRSRLDDFAAYTFFVDASDGSLVHVRDEIYHVEISGHVSGHATPGTVPDVDYNPAVEMSMENVHVFGPATTFTDEHGDYVLPYDGSDPVLVWADLVGQWVWVFPYEGPSLVLASVAHPPEPLDFVFNPLPEAFSTAQVNAFVHATLTHDFYKHRQPDFTGLDVPLFSVVNLPYTCNAFFSSAGPLIAFFEAGDGCANTAYSSIIAHEYGHFIVDRLGLAQGAFGEGFSDTVGVLLYDDPVSGRDIRGPGTFGRDIAAANKQYPCADEIHACGQVLAGCWWDIRLELSASLGEPAGLEVTRQLFTDWSQITVGGLGSDSAHPLTLIEVLVADDDDGDLRNGTPHDCEIVSGFAAHGIETLAFLLDCDGDGTPDRCQISGDCNQNGIGDLCDVVFGTSLDCNANLIPDECEADCNANGVPDDCDIAQATSADCTGNGVPDECEPDCNGNGTADSCDLALGRGTDCNGNGTPDACDIAAAPDADTNGNGILDVCDFGICDVLWDGFEPDPPFHFQRPLAGDPADLQATPPIDYIPAGGDASSWSNPANPRTAVTFPFGCETEDIFDDGVQVIIDDSLAPVVSEYFRTVDGQLDCGAATYALSFRARIEDVIDSKWDWKFTLYDADSGLVVTQLLFSSTQSERVDPADRGFILINTGSPTFPDYFNTGVALELMPHPQSGYLVTPCYRIEVTLDNRGADSAGDRMGVSVDGDLKLLTRPLQRNAHRIDFFELVPIQHLGGSSSAPAFRLDRFEFCVHGPALMAWADCNVNCVDDASDIAGLVSEDCNSNAVPDECEPFTDCNRNGRRDSCDVSRGSSNDCNTNSIPDECEADCNENSFPDDCDIAGGTSADCTLNGIPDDCDILAGTSADCNSNGIPDGCEPDEDCNDNGVQDICDLAVGASADCNTNDVPDECDIGAGVSGDCNSNGVPDECEADTDADGVIDGCDVCPDSDLGETIVIDGCDTGVRNVMAGDDGCSMADHIADCRASAVCLMPFLRCVAELAASWGQEGLIDWPDQRRIRLCAARAALPRRCGLTLPAEEGGIGDGFPAGADLPGSSER